MATFKYIGHLHGVPPRSDGTILIRGTKKPAESGSFEIQVTPGASFEIPDGWGHAVLSLENQKVPTNPSQPLYERLS